MEGAPQNNKETLPAEELVSNTESKDALRSEHLKEGVKPIMACVGTPEQLTAYQQEIFLTKERNPDETPRILEIRTDNAHHYVNYYEGAENLTKKGMKNSGERTYVISPIDGMDKLSTSYRNCTGVVVAGRDRETGKEVSFLSHQDPHYFLREPEKRDNFLHDLDERLEELKKRCELGTIDAVVVGGNSDRESGSQFATDYLASIQLLSGEVQKTLGFQPVIMTGPKMIPEGKGGDEHVLYQNQERRLYIMRPVVGDKSTETFVHDTVEKQKKEW